MKVAVIHHNNDMDGLMSGTISLVTWKIIKYILEEKFPTEIIDFNIIGYNYGTNPKEDEWLDFNSIDNQYDYYQFIDVTPPLDWLINIELEKFYKRIEIFDHHKPVFQKIKELSIFKNNYRKFSYYFDEYYCGAYIYWFNLFTTENWISNLFIYKKSIIQKYHNNKIIKSIVSELKKLDTEKFYQLLLLVDSYDTWKWQNSKIINYNALYTNEYFSSFKTINEYYKILFSITNKIEIVDILNFGKTISDYKKSCIANKKYINRNLYDKNILIINDKASIYYIDFMKENGIDCDGILFYNDIDFDKMEINLSMRSVKRDFDCNEFVNKLTNNGQHGKGGGHQGSAGCNMLFNTFKEIIKNNN